ncbi:MAG TPA: sigma-70 family RNA polymerase sigma factor [Ktedonobacteraceae bacterium]|jgi:RNA polymerase sigma-70 factor (ECF subfamily)
MQFETPASMQYAGFESTDALLARRILAGDEDAFTALVQRYSAPLFNFIAHFLRDDDEACDVLQHVFTQCYLSLPHLRTTEPLKPWLFRVARNRCLDELRRKRGIPFSELQAAQEEEELSPLEAIPDPGLLPEELADQHDLQETLRQAIDALPAKYRSIVLLRYAGQLTFVEIAAILKIPQATAKTYFQRAKPLLRASLAGRVPMPARG